MPGRTYCDELPILTTLLAVAPMTAVAQSGAYGPDPGDSEFTLSGTGAGDQDLDNGA